MLAGLAADAELFLPGLIAGLAVGAVAGPLSVLIVVKRLAFVGHGVAHSAFLGVGLAATLGVTAFHGLGVAGLVLLVAVAAAGTVALLARRGGDDAVQADTAIGVVLAATMAGGFLLLDQASRAAHDAARPPPPEVESVLFGSLIAVTPADAALACGVACVVLAAGLVWRRPVVLWAADESAARALGIRPGPIRLGLMIALALSIIAGVRLTGIVLTTGLFVLPGAAALRLTSRLVPALSLSTAAALLGVVGGFAVALVVDWPIGPSVVLVLASFFAAAEIARSAGAGRSARRTEAHAESQPAG